MSAATTDPALAQRLARVEAEGEVRRALALFSDIIARGDRAGFLGLWAADAVWEIGEPYPRVARGLDAIGTMLDDLMRGWEFFVQLTHASAIEVSADAQTARARTLMREFARQTDKSRSYDNFAMYDDALVRTAEGWRFARRAYHYLWLDDTPIPGRGFALPGGLGAG